MPAVASCVAALEDSDLFSEGYGGRRHLGGRQRILGDHCMFTR